MTYADAHKHCQRLTRIVKLTVSSLDQWLALLEFEILLALPEKSKLIEQFVELKKKAQQSNVVHSDNSDSEVIESFRPQFEQLIESACEEILANSYVAEDLRDQVERIIHTGYFKSIYFRAIVGGFAFVLLLVTGVEGWQLESQVKAMKQMVEESRHEVEEGQRRIEAGKEEIAKAQFESQEQQGKLALMLLDGDQRLVDMRTKALSQIEADGIAQESVIRERADHWTKEIDSSVSEEAEKKVRDAGEFGEKAIDNLTTREQKVYEHALEVNRMRLEAALDRSLTNLGAAQRPWVPAVLWSSEKRWLLIPFAVFLAVLSIFNCLIVFAVSQGNNLRVRNLCVLNLLFLLGIFVTQWIFFAHV